MEVAEDRAPAEALAVEEAVVQVDLEVAVVEEGLKDLLKAAK